MKQDQVESLKGGSRIVDKGFLRDEMQLGATLVRLGIFTMRAPGIYDLDLILVPMLIIGNGLERLSKVMLYLHSVLNDKPVDFKGNKHHDLHLLVHKVVKHCFTSDYMERDRIAKEDAEMLTSEPELNRILEVVARFNKDNRYFNLDRVAGAARCSKRSDDQWGEQFELPRTINHLEKTKKYPPIGSTAARDAAQAWIEKVVRAYARVLKNGSFGIDGYHFYKTIRDFYALTDSRLGKAAYEKWYLRSPEIDIGIDSSSIAYLALLHALSSIISASSASPEKDSPPIPQS